MRRREGVQFSDRRKYEWERFKTENVVTAKLFFEKDCYSKRGSGLLRSKTRTEEEERERTAKERIPTKVVGSNDWLRRKEPFFLSFLLPLPSFFFPSPSPCFLPSLSVLFLLVFWRMKREERAHKVKWKKSWRRRWSQHNFRLGVLKRSQSEENFQNRFKRWKEEVSSL